MEATEKRIVELCKLGSQEGYELLFLKYRHFIYGVCLHYVRSKDDALDLTQEVFIKLYRNFHRFDATRPLAPWVKRIAVNTCLSYAGSRTPQLMPTEDLAATIIDTARPSDNLELLATNVALEQAVRELPKQERMALVLRHAEQMSYAEISNAMGCPEGTIKTYIFRARNLLRAKLKVAGILEG